MKKKELENRQLNIGIEILRFLLCFWIVIIHCSNVKKAHQSFLSKKFHVPTFIFLSFYFSFQAFRKREITKIISRFQRLLIPYVLWPSIILIINNFLHFFFSFGQFSKKLTMNDMYVQILVGSRFHGVFWFQFNLLFLSLSFTIISFIFKEKNLEILKLLGIIAFYLHISQINYKFLFNYEKYIKGSLGGLIELLPIAVIGCIFSSVNLLLKIKNFSYNSKLIMLFIICVLFKYKIFTILNGCIYSNVPLNLFASTILFIFFGSLSFNKLKKKNIIIIYATKFTGGIYYTHTIFRSYLTKYSIFFHKRTYLSSTFIYIICYYFCFIGNKLFEYSKLKYLFI